MSPVPETIEAADQPPGLRRRFRMLGVWTWQNAPGEMTHHYRDDGKMHITVAPNNTSLYFRKWRVDGNVMSLESVERNQLKFIVKKVFRKHEQYQVTFNADGNITFKSVDGTIKVLIPWSSDQGEFLKQSE